MYVHGQGTKCVFFCNNTIFRDVHMVTVEELKCILKADRKLYAPESATEISLVESAVGRATESLTQLAGNLVP